MVPAAAALNGAEAGGAPRAPPRESCTLSSAPWPQPAGLQAAIAISYNPELHSRTKHIDRRHFFIREWLELRRLPPIMGFA